MIHDLKRQGLSVAVIARKTGLDRKTIGKYLDRGLEAPVYGPRQPRPRRLEAYEDYLRQRIASFPDLSGKRLLREIVTHGYRGGYTAVTDFLRDVRPPQRAVFERRFETSAGQQAQVDFAEFKVGFDDEPGVTRKVWLFSMVLGHSRWLWGRFCAGQDLQTVLRCHLTAFGAMGGAPEEVLYDRMKTAVIGEDAEGVVTYNKSLVSLLNHYGCAPRACRPYRAKTKGKVERPFRYIRRRVSHDGMISLGGNLYSVPDATRKRVVEVQNHPDEVRIFEDGTLIASHPVLEGKNQRRVDPAHRKAPPMRTPTPVARVARRPLDFYDAVGHRLAGQRAVS